MDLLDSDDNAGELTIGTINPTRYTGDIVYIDALTAGFEISVYINYKCSSTTQTMIRYDVAIKNRIK